MLDQNPLEIVSAHSPDSDDAFMFYGLATRKVRSSRVTFRHVLSDIETLNRKAVEGVYDLSAISYHAYPYVADNYVLMASGSSVGDGYGPMVVALHPMEPEEIKGKRIAIPGTMTTAFLAASIALGKGFQNVVKPFDEILQYVEAGHADAGLIIHEGQLTFQQHGLVCCLDLGKWWMEKHKLPLPLGGNVIRRDLGMERMLDITAILKKSIQFSLDHRKEAVQYSLKYGRDLNATLADEFVGMYVNKWTLDYGPIGRQAIDRLLKAGADKKLVPPIDKIDFVTASK
jgi:1,4-dihydroxy-6-naphthoate synthase